jgi:hypothetical protein
MNNRNTLSGVDIGEGQTSTFVGGYCRSQTWPFCVIQLEQVLRTIFSLLPCLQLSCNRAFAETEGNIESSAAVVSFQIQLCICNLPSIL